MSWHDLSPQEQKSLLYWSATGHGWFASTDELDIFVPENVYERSLLAYLVSQGIERKTWSELMKPCEEAWKRQCEAEQTFQADLDQWLTSSEIGVYVKMKNKIRDRK